MARRPSPACGLTSSEGTYDLQLTRYDEKRGRATFYMTGMAHSPTSATGAEELTPGDLPFLRFAPEAQELFDGWRAELERKLRADEGHPVLLSQLAKYRSLMPSLALIGSLIDAVTGGPCGPVSRAAAEQAIAWCSHRKRTRGGSMRR